MLIYPINNEEIVLLSNKTPLRYEGKVNYKSLLVTAGLNTLLINFAMYSGNELTATITAVFQRKLVVRTNERSEKSY